MPFQRGANPFSGASREPMELLESITPAQLASCVPFVKIQKIEKFGRPATDVRPLMFDLTQTPQFAGAGLRFGTDDDTLAERALVSLNSLDVDFELNYGQQQQRVITLDFTVHRPAVVFDRFSRTAWREILEEGKSFSLEYGWAADPVLVPNELFNGIGMVTAKGLVVKGTQSILLNIYTYSVTIMKTGEVRVVAKARENGDLALRETKFSDVFDRTLGPGQPEADDETNMRRLKGMLDTLLRRQEVGRKEYFTMGDILDKIVAPMVTGAALNWGYTSVDLLLGDFNAQAGPQSEYFGGRPVSKPWNGSSGGIGEFLVPVAELMGHLSSHFGKGRTLYLRNFVEMLISIMNAEGAWAHPKPGQDVRQPNVMAKYETVRRPDGTHGLVFVIYDVKVGTAPFSGTDALAVDRQSRAEVMRKLASLDVPVLEFARAGSLILDATFELQPDPLLQSIQAESVYKDRKDKVQTTATPDVRSRAGAARAGELVMPISILQGDIQMQGNFALETFGILWIDFFGSSEISGVFHVFGKTDRLEAGKFSSNFKVMAESIDPLNTRKRLS